MQHRLDEPGSGPGQQLLHLAVGGHGARQRKNLGRGVDREDPRPLGCQSRAEQRAGRPESHDQHVVVVHPV